jgi:hypothetical protein
MFHRCRSWSIVLITKFLAGAWIAIVAMASSS